MRAVVFLSNCIVLIVQMTSCEAQDAGRSTDLVSAFKPRVNVATGQWAKDDDEIRIAAGATARAVFAENVPKDYSVDVELTRQRGAEVVALVLPVGPTSVALELGGWGGESHGLARVDGQPTRSEENPTSVRPGKLENGRRYRLSVRVSAEGGNCQVSATLDRKKLIDWKGSVSRLRPHLVFNLPKPDSLGFASKENDVVIHKFVLTDELSPVSKPSSPASTPAFPATKNDLVSLDNLVMSGMPGWEPFNDARFTSDSSSGSGVIQAVAGAGQGDRGAFVVGDDFADGVIEVELKGDSRPQSSFVGVAFGGKDGETYESVYFRTFNFGSTDAVKRSHAVQYIAHPDWPWERLRKERSGQFEKPVSPEPGSIDWFKARVEVAGDTVRVFVNESKVPSLQVKRLATRRSGKVGLWFNGVGSFRNLKISPTRR
tara:strand:- start:55163 stop:56452 length:1290 start_codon:yes stop_codon:yes gene_type:complete